MMPLHDETLARIIEAEHRSDARAIALARSLRRSRPPRPARPGILAGLRWSAGRALIRMRRRLSSSPTA